jgi:uncharacterized protein with PQ loop repeat
MTALIGWLVGIIDVSQFLPQATRTVRLRHDHAAMHGLSLWTWTIATLQGAAWVVYGFGERLLPIAIPNLVITPICAAILGIRVRHRAQRLRVRRGPRGTS